MTKEPRVNLHRIAANIVLGCSLMRWFACTGHRDEVMAAIEIQRFRTRDSEDQALTSWSGTAAASNNKRTLDLNQVPFESAQY